MDIISLVVIAAITILAIYIFSGAKQPIPNIPELSPEEHIYISVEETETTMHFWLYEPALMQDVKFITSSPKNIPDAEIEDKVNQIRDMFKGKNITFIIRNS